MAYDPATAQMVLFGGQSTSGDLNDTWTWDGTTWTQLFPATSPSTRSYTSMAYDSATAQMVLFGGATNTGGFLNDTWTWDGTTWSQLFPATSPPARNSATMSYDPATTQLVLFGGGGIGGGWINDTWTYGAPATVTLTPPAATSSVGTSDTVTATVTDASGNPISGSKVSFDITSGPNAGATSAAVTDTNGVATFTYSSLMFGTDTVQASIIDPGSGQTVTSNSVTVTWVLSFAPGGGSFVVGDGNSAVATAVTFWGSQWSKNNSLSGGSAPASFKGYAPNPAVPTCGATLSTGAGNSTSPPSGPLPTYMGVIVSSAVTKSGSMISATIAHIVVVKTNSGYMGDPGHPGTGIVVAQVC